MIIILMIIIMIIVINNNNNNNLRPAGAATNPVKRGLNSETVPFCDGIHLRRCSSFLDI